MKKYNNIGVELIKSDILEQHKQILDDFKCVYIFGAGRLGLMCAQSCKLKGIKVRGFIDKSKNLQGGNIEGINVYSLHYYLDNKKPNRL
jgi:FlaA1/EpsC-like NDP-sugar epimerase